MTRYNYKALFLPTNWTVATLEDCINDFIDYRGQTPPKADCGIPLITAKNIKKGFLDLSEMEYIEIDSFAKWMSRGLPKPGDVLLTTEAPLGNVAQFPVNSNYALAQRVVTLRAKEKNLSNTFLKYYLLSEIGQRALFLRSSGSTAIGIRQTELRKVEIYLPPLQEQYKITQLLDNWSHAIELTQNLIDAKTRFKRGLAQQLLTGKKRFREFVGQEWKTFRLGEIFRKREETNFSHLELLSITSKNGVVKRDSLDKRDTSSQDKSKYLHILPGDIGYNTMRMWQGVSGLSEYEGIVSPAYTVCVPSSKVYGKFISYLFKFEPVIYLFKRYSQGLVDDTLGLKFEAFAQIKVTIPSLDEQRKIADVLNACDKEIELLNKQLEAIKKQKQGLMQKLLTGQIRVM